MPIRCKQDRVSGALSIVATGAAFSLCLATLVKLYPIAIGLLVLACTCIVGIVVLDHVRIWR